MPVKVTMFFNLGEGHQNCGWSESYVDQSSTLLQAANNWFSNQSAYIGSTQPVPTGLLRCQSLGAGVVMQGARLTLLVAGRPPVPSVKRQILDIGPIASVLNSAISYNIFMLAHPSDYGEVKLLLRANAIASSPYPYVRTMWLGGLADDATSSEQPQLLPGPWSTPITQFINSMIKNSLLTDIDHSSGNPPAQVQAFIQTTGLITTVNPHGFLLGNKVIATGFKGQAGQPIPKGVYTVVEVPSASTFNIAFTPNPNYTVAPTGGFFRAVSFVYPAIGFISTLGVTKRNVGRPFDLSVGRRPKVRNPRG